MLEGLNYPLTPRGKSTLNPLPPWYYSADFLEIEFWSDPGAVAALLPKGLDLDASANGHCNALFYDSQFTGDNEEYLDPARYQYREFFILVNAPFEDKPVAYCPYICGQRCGDCLRIGPRLSEAPGPDIPNQVLRRHGKGGPPLAPGSKFTGSLAAGGQRLAEGLVTLKEPVTNRSLLKQRPVVNLLHYPRLAADMRNKPALHELVENVPHDVKIEQAWIGNGSLTLPVCRGEEISDLAPLRCGMGLRASMAYVVDDLKTLKDLRI